MLIKPALRHHARVRRGYQRLACGWFEQVCVSLVSIIAFGIPRWCRLERLRNTPIGRILGLFVVGFHLLLHPNNRVECDPDGRTLRCWDNGLPALEEIARFGKLGRAARNITPHRTRASAGVRAARYECVHVRIELIGLHVPIIACHAGRAMESVRWS